MQISRCIETIIWNNSYTVGIVNICSIESKFDVKLLFLRTNHCDLNFPRRNISPRVNQPSPPIHFANRMTQLFNNRNYKRAANNSRYIIVARCTYKSSLRLNCIINTVRNNAACRYCVIGVRRGNYRLY